MSDPLTINAVQKQDENAELKTRRIKPQDKELQKACQAFEETFLKIILKEAHINRGMNGGDGASQLYSDMSRESLAKAMAEAGGLGLAEMLYRQLSDDRDMPATPYSGLHDKKITTEGE